VNRLLVLTLATFAALAMVHADFADAARMGGGRSLGMQRSITPPAARPAVHEQLVQRPGRQSGAAGEAGNGRSPPRPPEQPPPRGRHRGHRAGSARSPDLPPGSASLRCSRISACPKGSAACC
jgi:hypothetical protein